MKTVIISIIIAAIVMFVAGGAMSQHYYGGGNAIDLHIDSTRLIIRFNNSVPVAQQENLLNTIGRIEAVLQDDHVINNFLACSLLTSQGYEDFLDSLGSISEVDLVEPYYRDDYDSAFLVGQHFCVAFQEDISQNEIDATNDLFGVTTIQPVAYMPNVFTLQNSKATGMRMLDLANAYYNLDVTRYSHPSFSIRPVLSSYNLYDYYADYQPHTKKVIGEFNQASVWDFAGLTKPITVAVIDNGVDSHEDLPEGRVLAGYDFVGADWHDPTPDSDPSPGDEEYHGMSCAGIVGASHTIDTIENQGKDVADKSTGIIGLNPHVRILPIKIFDDSGRGTYSVAPIASAISYAWQNGADILSNSWGYPYGQPPNYDILNDAIERATLFGRSNRGCPVIFASGNWATSYTGVSYPANLPTTLAVGATKLDDNRWHYSQYGTMLDLVAPSDDGNTVGVWSLDQMGNKGGNSESIPLGCPPGSNDIDYNCRFGGTSAACPIVSGIASLLLSKDSTLSSTAVYYILRNSAVTDLDWGSIVPPSPEYGWGRVDAYRAVQSISPRGDADNSGGISVGDINFMVAYLWQSGPAPDNESEGDPNCDGEISVGDINYLVAFLWQGGPQPEIPCFEF